MKEEIIQKMNEIKNRIDELKDISKYIQKINEIQKEIQEVINELTKIALPSGYWVEYKTVKNYPQKREYQYYYLRWYDENGRIRNKYLGKELPKWVEDGLWARDVLRSFEAYITELERIKEGINSMLYRFKSISKDIEDYIERKQ